MGASCASRKPSRSTQLESRPGRGRGSGRVRQDWRMLESEAGGVPRMSEGKGFAGTERDVHFNAFCISRDPVRKFRVRDMCT